MLGTKVGRLVAEHFADPARLATLGEARFIRFAATRGLQVRKPVVERLLTAAPDALPCPDAAVARQVLTNDLVLLARLDEQIMAAEAAMAALLPLRPFGTLTSVPGWGWPSPAPLTPAPTSHLTRPTASLRAGTPWMREAPATRSRGPRAVSGCHHRRVGSGT